jgi:hypothetical protein
VRVCALVICRVYIRSVHIRLADSQRISEHYFIVASCVVRRLLTLTDGRSLCQRTRTWRRVPMVRAVCARRSTASIMQVPRRSLSAYLHLTIISPAWHKRVTIISPGDPPTSLLSTLQLPLHTSVARTSRTPRFTIVRPRMSACAGFEGPNRFGEMAMLLLEFGADVHPKNAVRSCPKHGEQTTEEH